MSVLQLCAKRVLTTTLPSSLASFVLPIAYLLQKDPSSATMILHTLQVDLAQFFAKWIEYMSMFNSEVASLCY